MGWYHDGTAYATMANDPALTIPNDDWGFVGWFRLPAGNPGSDSPKILAWGTPGATPHVQIYVTQASSSDRLRARYINSAGGDTGILSISAINLSTYAGEWMAFCLTHDKSINTTYLRLLIRSIHTIYIDSVYPAYTPITDNTDIPADMYLGCSSDLGTDYFVGDIAELAFIPGTFFDENTFHGFCHGSRGNKFPGCAWHVPMLGGRVEEWKNQLVITPTNIADSENHPPVSLITPKIMAAPRPENHQLLSHSLSLTDSLTSIKIITKPIDSSLPLGSTFYTGGAFYADFTSELTSDVIKFDDNGDPYIYSYRLGHSIDRKFIGSPAPNDTIHIIHDFEVELVKASGISESFDSTLSLSDSWEIDKFSYFIIDTLTLTQSLENISSTGIDGDLTVTHDFEINGTFNKTIESELELSDSWAFYKLDEDGVLCNYSPSVGSTTDPNAPSPPSTTAPSLTATDGVTLEYPTIAPTSIVTLSGPEFNNKDSMQFQRINRTTRGGTLIIYADPNWNKSFILSLEFNALTEVECQDVLDFVEASLGKNVKLTDWEGREWTGIITNPDSPISRVGRPGNMLTLEFEAELA